MLMLATVDDDGATLALTVDDESTLALIDNDDAARMLVDNDGAALVLVDSDGAARALAVVDESTLAPSERLALRLAARDSDGLAENAALFESVGKQLGLIEAAA